jgi:hypothetical protein
MSAAGEPIRWALEVEKRVYEISLLRRCEMKYLKIVILLGILVFSTACQSDGKLPFKTIAQDDGGWGYMGEKPTLLIITDPVEIATSELEIHIPSGLAVKLRQLDYDRFFAILVLQGLKSTGGFSITVQRLSRENHQVTVWGQFVEPGPGTWVTGAFTSPYHLIAVSKRGEWGQLINFVLVADSEEVAEISHFIP